MTEKIKLTAARRKFLEMLLSGPKLVSQVEGSGSRVPGQLRRDGLIRKCDHSTVKDAGGFPADAYELTEIGAEALRRERGLDE